MAGWPHGDQLVISYDVVDDARRTRLRRRIQLVGDRFQQSGYVVHRPGSATPEALVQDLAEELSGEDRLMVHRPCAACGRRLLTVPEGLVGPVGAAWVVVAAA